MKNFSIWGEKIKVILFDVNSLLLNFRSDWRPALLSALEMRKLWTYLYTCWTWPAFGKPQATWLICKLHSGHGASASLNLEYQTNQQDMACLAPLQFKLHNSLCESFCKVISALLALEGKKSCKPLAVGWIFLSSYHNFVTESHRYWQQDLK